MMKISRPDFRMAYSEISWSRNRKRGPAHENRQEKPKMTALAKQDMAAARRAAKTARRVAKMHGTPVVYLKDGKIIYEYPK
jgi:hypothetical protein